MDGGLNGMIALVVLAGDAVAILNIVTSPRPARNKALWVAIVVVLPVLGLAIWIFLGPRDAIAGRDTSPKP